MRFFGFSGPLPENEKCLYPRRLRLLGQTLGIIPNPYAKWKWRMLCQTKSSLLHLQAKDRVMEMWKTAACADGKPIRSLWKRTSPFPQVCKQVSHSTARAGSLRTFPQRLLLRIAILSFQKEVEYRLCPDINAKEQEYISRIFHREAVLLLCIIASVEKSTFVRL